MKKNLQVFEKHSCFGNSSLELCYFLSGEKGIDWCFTSPVKMILLSLKCFCHETIREIKQGTHENINEL